MRKDSFKGNKGFHPGLNPNPNLNLPEVLTSHASNLSSTAKAEIEIKIKIKITCRA